ncbi:L,D-transpeptidase family protein [Vitreoscilla massiliensis]|uniref:L,D-transpeptidase family protein n=1 Tax=Vitreoscilla massiliensis TaxID=1689272 RepID=A0ABY4EAI1_9NEIS|nr:L,D-transpeptidase family protein [Vitreoscilla massiliensis]UOO90432.1 L,D-transpeptidase family protein [Vitreoscilla massiliensis]
MSTPITKRCITIALLALILIAAAWAWQRYQSLLPSRTASKTAPQSVNWQQVRIDEVHVYKSQRQVRVLQNGQVIKTYAMRLGFTPLGHKTTEGDGKTPEGRYNIDWRNPNSQFYKSLHISYPNAADKAQAQARGVSAGGDIMIHGSSNLPQGQPKQALYDYLPRNDWTHGCISVSNQDMDELWRNVKNGTKIEIYP